MVLNSRLSAWDISGLLLVTVASIIGINQYIYGMYNHFITIPFLKDVINPELYPGDFLIAERKYFYTYFLSGIGYLINLTGITPPSLFFVLYSLSLFTTFIGIFKIALSLFGKKEVAWLSVIFLVFSFTSLGEVRTVESLFLERTLTLPLQLFAIYYFLNQRISVSSVLLGIAFLFHPLSTVYVVGFLSLVLIFNFRETGAVKFFTFYLIIGLFAAPVIFLKIQNPAPSLSLFNPDPQWIELLRLRSAHHLFPFMWDWKMLLKAILFLVGFVICWKHKPEARLHKIVVISSAAILLMCLLATLFTEIIPVSIIVQFQLFRSFKFLIYLAVIYYANYFFTEGQHHSNWSQKIIVFLLVITIFYGDNLPKFLSFFLIAVSTFPLINFIQRFKKELLPYLIPTQILALLFLGLAGNVLRGGNFTIQTTQEQKWMDVQEWAKKNTAITDAFIVPPNHWGFRVESERTIYGDWKDGTQMFFNPEFGTEWIRRMKMLGYIDDDRLEETFMALEENNFRAIATELKKENNKVFLVMPADRKEMQFEQVYDNEGFMVYVVQEGN